MFTKKYYLVFDCEGTDDKATFGDGKHDKPQVPYDLSGVVMERNGNIVDRFAFLCEEVFTDCKLMDSAYYKRKMPEYLRRLANGEIEPMTASDIFTAMAELVDQWGLDDMWAYNADYDMNALRNLFAKYRRKHGFDREAAEKVLALRPRDIMTAAVETLVGPRKYYNFVKENNLFSAKGNVKYGAEIMYRFITGQMDFIEEHKGLDDAIIESEILVRVFKAKKKVNADLAPEYYYKRVNAKCKHNTATPAKKKTKRGQTLDELQTALNEARARVLAKMAAE